MRLWLTALAKVIDDETTVVPDPGQPGQRRVKERPQKGQLPPRLRQLARLQSRRAKGGVRLGSGHRAGVGANICF